MHLASRKLDGAQGIGRTQVGDPIHQQMRLLEPARLRVVRRVDQVIRRVALG